MGPSCCSIGLGEEEKKGGVDDSQDSGRVSVVPQVVFSHVFAVENKGKIDAFYKVNGLGVSDTKLGEGFNGIVYKAQHRLSNAERAVKSLPREKKHEFKMGAQAAHLKFAKSVDKELPSEVIILRSMDHPNIVKLHEIFKDAKRVYLVMELCDGGDMLDAVLRASKNGTFNEREAAIYFEQVLLSVAYLHGQNVAHRDVKSEHFLLQNPGLLSGEERWSERSVIKLIDFGLASFTAGRYMTTKCGSALHMAPEVAQCHYTKKCDVWSCGVLLYIMLIGSPPFHGDNDLQILEAVEQGVVKFSAGCHTCDVSPGAKAFIGLLLEKDAQKRLDAGAALQHRFITSGDSARKHPLTGLADRLRQFNSSRQLKKICLTVIAKQFSKDEVRDLHVMFKTLDKNCDGTLSKKELVEGLGHFKKAGMKLQLHDVASLMESLDSDASGSVDYTEFIAAALERQAYSTEDALWSAFRTFDIDGNGKIEMSELKALIQSAAHLQFGVCSSSIEMMLRDADTNKDGHLDFHEFSKLICEE